MQRNQYTSMMMMMMMMAIFSARGQMKNQNHCLEWINIDWITEMDCCTKRSYNRYTECQRACEIATQRNASFVKWEEKRREDKQRICVNIYEKIHTKKLIIDINCHNCYLEHTIFVNFIDSTTTVRIVVVLNATFMFLLSSFGRISCVLVAT